MREQVEATVERILALEPASVLEIGCGTGLLLFRLAPHCRRYCATDFSAAAIRYVGRQVGGSLPQTELRHRAADDFTGIEPGSFDVVVLNSVVQYFPGAAYLERVLRAAMLAVRPGGYIFVGDVRSLELREAFYASVEMARADPAATREDIRARVKQRKRHEQELLVRPEFFERLRTGGAAAVECEVQLKRGRAANELTRFRYDVVLQVGPPSAQVPPSARRRHGTTSGASRNSKTSFVISGLQRSWCAGADERPPVRRDRCSRVARGRSGGCDRR